MTDAIDLMHKNRLYNEYGPDGRPLGLSLARPRAPRRTVKS